MAENTNQDNTFTYNRFAGLNPLAKLGLILSEGAMAFGEGLGGGKPYSNYMDMQAQQAKMAYEQWQQRQQQEAFKNLIGGAGAGRGGNGTGIVSPYTLIPDPTKPMGFRTEIDPAYKAQVEVDKQVSAQASKEKEDALRDFKIATNKLKVTMAAFKAMAQEAQGAGRVAGLKNLFGGATGKNPYVKPYEGQLVEAASALAKLAAPSARIGQEIIQQFKKTLPTKFSTMDEAVTQIRFSLHNAFATALGQAGETYTPEIQKQVDEFVNDIASAEPMTLKGLEKFKKGELPEVGSVKNGYRFIGGNPANPNSWEKVK